VTTKTSAQEFVQQQIGIWNRHDAAAVAAAYSMDASVYDPAYPEPLKGRDAVQKDAGDFFAASRTSASSSNGSSVTATPSPSQDAAPAPIRALCRFPPA
jgi:ketosteroid isomerase-like protein